MFLQALRRWWPLAAVGVLLVAAGLSAAHATPRLDRIAQDPEPDLIQPTFEAPQEPSRQAGPDVDSTAGIDFPGWLRYALYAVLFGLLAAVVVIVVWSLVSRLFRRAASGDAGPDGRTGPARPSRAEVLAAVDAGLADLSDADADPRRAVIACWLRLEEAAEAAGMPRHPADTPTDLVLRLLGEDPDGGVRVVSAEVLARFAEIYREARYATHTIDEAMREQARTALRRLRAELTPAAVR